MSASVQLFNKLPAPTLETYAWQAEGECRKYDPETFFLPYNSRGADKEERTQRAKAVCGKCAVVEQCLKFSLDTAQEFGVWGGLSEDERRAVIRKTARTP